MKSRDPVRIGLPLRIGLALAVAAGMAGSLAAQSLPSPYRLVDEWPRLPAHMNGGRWGETIGVDRDADGNIWVFHRCFNNRPPGAATCVGRDDDPPVVKFSPDGRLLDSWGEGVFAAPHGFHIDPEGNIWATDYNGSDTVLGMPAGGRGHQVFKFSPTGELLMTLGRAGVAGNGPDTFDRPTDVAVNAGGDIFVTDGHGPNNRVVKFDRNGRFLLTWGRPGDGPGEFDQPHTITLDSRGGCSSAIARTAACRSSSPTGRSSPSGSSSGGRAGCSSTRTTCSTSPTRPRTRGTTPASGAGSTSGAPSTAPCTPTSPTPMLTGRTSCASRGVGDHGGPRGQHLRRRRRPAAHPEVRQAVGSADRHIPQTVTGAAPSPAGASRRKIFSSQVLVPEGSKTSRCPDSAPQRSM